MGKKEENPTKRPKNTAFSPSYRFYGKTILFTLSGAIMIGHGARMIYQGIFAQGTFYAPNTFDLFFDWLTLAILGCFILWFAFSLWYQSIRKKTNHLGRDTRSEDKPFIHPT